MPPDDYGDHPGNHVYYIDGYDQHGYDRKGFDKYGYNSDGLDSYGDPKKEAYELDLRDQWAEFRRYGRPGLVPSETAQRADFRLYLRAIVSDPNAIDDFGFCEDCGDPEWCDDLQGARGGTSLCESCWESWTRCESCEETYPGNEVSTLLNESDVCNGCRAATCSYCDSCDGYYWDGDEEEHEHDSRDDGCCESPQLTFAIRNNGDEPLASDTRATITLPSGVISAEGLAEIQNCLNRQYHDSSDYNFYRVASDLDALGDQWQTPAGNYTKRLSSHAYKAHGVKLTPEIVSQVGCIARDHSKPVDVRIEVTRDLNMSSADFGNDGSCWWSSYSASRCTLKTNGGFGLRTFDDDDEVSGRAWVMCLRQRNGKLYPTFDASPDAFVTFNGYGDLDGYAAARVLAHMAGWTYKKTGFRCDPMYVNNSSGYLVAPEPVVASHARDGVGLVVSQHSGLFSTEQLALTDKARREELAGAAIRERETADVP
jgi:hypothetical protein